MRMRIGGVMTDLTISGFVTGNPYLFGVIVYFVIMEAKGGI